MQVFLAGAAGLLGVVLIVAGVKGNGSHLFTAITGVGVTAPAASSSGTAPSVATGKGGAVAVPLGPTGPGANAPVWT